ncbi:FecR domain-containing protein [Singulisphaera acidiphila]|uniref:Fe2+-dicitrate sensor, membrane component n=1 Tax=Singulisphaera acidiphila (strain ATCC BAA-1392 / DSM 18658 / VKM B-2454 / MOB10) TaxID=886293 RepID=L0DT91_SINAD|nr:FecR domain-containing protein [Singulisphaera acidiphila]AGA31586.1 Fe2+-dicitrate sensor, membrane component [Singulisphaera acidiphila DSM 18658]
MKEGGEELELLIDAVIDGRCDEAGLRRFEELLRNDPQAREAYLDQMKVHALLEWRHGRVEPRVDRSGTGSESGRVWWSHGRLRWGLAALALIGVGLSLLALRFGHRGGGEVATLLEARNVVWGTASPIAVKSRLSPQAIRCTSGLLRLAFDSGALVTLEGPADLRILSGMRLRAIQGRITARVESETKGFAIETPSTLVVDQGTEFGVEVDANGRTGVVVFEGLVDLSRPKSAATPAEVTRLVQGEALRVDREGGLSRIIAVERAPGNNGWSTGPSSEPDAVIRSVHDNIRGLDSSKYYQIVPRGLDDDAPAYVDRPHEWNGLDSSGLPAFLRGADYIMPFNEDKWRNDLEITVELACSASLYVFIDNREKVPTWLAERFTDTGVDIGLDEGSWPDPSMFTTDRGPGLSINQIFSVWRRDVDQGESINLGALMGGRNNRAMYGIAATVRL